MTNCPLPAIGLPGTGHRGHVRGVTVHLHDEATSGDSTGVGDLEDYLLWLVGERDFLQDRELVPVHSHTLDRRRVAVGHVTAWRPVQDD